MPPADQLPLPGLSGHPTRRDDRGHPVRRTPGGGLTGHAAFDYGTDLWVSRDGVPANTYRLKRPLPRRPLCHDPVEATRLLFAEGPVVTEAPTLSSFKMRGRVEEVQAVLDRHPDKGLYTIGSQSVQNELRRQWRLVEAGTVEPSNLLAAELARLGRPYNAAEDHGLAAATIWTLAARHPPKKWRRPHPDEIPYSVDPVRPHVGGLIQMRSDGYPDRLWRRHVVPYLPLSSGDLTEDQHKIMCNGQEWARDRCSALVWSLSEPASRSRRGWERVLGASSHGRKNLYRQMLSAGKPHAHYQPKHHFTRLRFTRATRALRQLRSMILAEHPDLPGTPP
jgi:hypothetical protein